MTINPISGLPLAATSLSNVLSSTPVVADNTSTSTPNISDILNIFGGNNANTLTALRQSASDSIATLSTAQTASQSLSSVDDILRQLQQLAARATSGDLGSTERQALNTQFQTLVGKLGQLGSTQFAGKTLFDGTFSLSQSSNINALGGETAALQNGNDQTTVNLPNLQAPFGNQTLDLSSSQDAQAAVQALGSTAQTVDQAQQQTFAFVKTAAAATVANQIALQNSFATTAIFGDSSIGDDSSSLLSALQGNAASATSAQGNLPASVLDLIGG